jgi:hypothetical protein
MPYPTRQGGTLPAYSHTWLDKAIAAGDHDMVSAYLDEQLGPITLPPPRIELTNNHDRLWMRWSLLHFTPLPNAATITALVCCPC